MTVSRRLLGLATSFLLTASVAACAAPASGEPADDEIVVYSGRNKALVGPILERFHDDTGTKVFVRYGDTASLAAQLLEEGERTKADVFFAQDAGALGAMSKAGRFQALPQSTLDQVDPRFRGDDGNWVGLSGRARVIAYDSDQLTEAEVPDSVLDLTDPRWKGQVGFAPTNASFQAFVTGMRELLGEERTREWLEGMKANDIQAYDNNVRVLDAVDDGQIALGLINHYYWYEKVAEEGEDEVSARVKFLPGGDPGGLVNVAGVGVLAGTDKPEVAHELVDYLLSEPAQTYFAEETAEYPLVDGVPTGPDLPPLESLDAPDIDLSDLDSLQETLELLEEVGLT